MKKFLKYLCLFFGIYILLYLLAPLSGVSNGREYTEPFYWLEILIVETVVLGSLIYFNEAPRRHVMIHPNRSTKQTVLWGIGIALFVLAWIGTMMLAISAPDGSPEKIVWIVVWALLIPLFVYLFIYRGISLYRNKKIRIFKVKVTAYKNAVIENIFIEDVGANAKLTVVINGQEHVFTVSKAMAPVYRMKLQQAKDVVEKDAFDSFWDKPLF